MMFLVFSLYIKHKTRKFNYFFIFLAFRPTPRISSKTEIFVFNH